MTVLENFQKLPPWLRISLLFPLAFLNSWLIFVLLDYFQPLSSLFLAAALLAFLLDLPVRLLTVRGLQRGWAIFLVLAIALFLLGMALLVLIPLIINQLSELLINLPQWIKSGNEQLNSLQAWAISHKVALDIDISQIVGETIQKITGILNSLGNQVFSFVGITISTIFNGLILMVLTIFLVITGEKVWDGIFSWLPSPWPEKLKEPIRETFERYFATQAMLAGILSFAQVLDA